MLLGVEKNKCSAQVFSRLMMHLTEIFFHIKNYQLIILFIINLINNIIFNVYAPVSKDQGAYCFTVVCLSAQT